MNKKLHTLFICLILLLGVGNMQAQNEADTLEVDIDTISQRVQVMDFGKYKGYIFPKEYGNEFYEGMDVVCFDVDTTMLRPIDRILQREYYDTIKQFMEQMFAQNLSVAQQNNDTATIKEIEQTRDEFRISYVKEKDNMTQLIQRAHRQYLGFVDENGDRMIKINLVDPLTLPADIDYEILKRGFIGEFDAESIKDTEIIHYNINLNRTVAKIEFWDPYTDSLPLEQQGEEAEEEVEIE